MAFQWSDNHEFVGAKPNFTRDQYDTIEAMAAVPKKKMPEMYIAFCLETHKPYIYNKQNDPDPILGLWREFESSGGSVYDDVNIYYSVVDDLSSITNLSALTNVTTSSISVSADGQYLVIVSKNNLKIFDENSLNNSYSFDKKIINVETDGSFVDEPTETSVEYNYYSTSTVITCENFNYNFKL